MSKQPECRICGHYISHGPVICESCLAKQAQQQAPDALATLREKCKWMQAYSCKPDRDERDRGFAAAMEWIIGEIAQLREEQR